MKKALFPIALILFSCKKEPPANPIADLNVKWTTNMTEETIRSYRNGVFTGETSKKYFETDDFTWDFSSTGLITWRTLPDNVKIGENRFTRAGDSIIFHPGDIFTGEVRARIVDFTSVDIGFRWLSVTKFSNGVDSTVTTLYLYKPSN